MLHTFNRTPVRFGKSIEEPTQDLIKNTLALWNVSMEDAAKFGGDLTRAALGALNLKNDRKYVVVDSKTHMLKPGLWPAFPGWHTDGAPRDSMMNPNGSGGSDFELQEAATRVPHYHLLVTGTGCLTEFAEDPQAIYLSQDSRKVYRDIHDQTEQALTLNRQRVLTAPSCTMTEWDWWSVHRGVVAKASEWRFLIRVLETDYLPPQTDPRQFIRMQQQVYVPDERFSW